MKKVLILISTYNGEKYINEQIESLVNQQNVDISILVRDDGSTDKTKEILKKWKLKGVLEWYEGENIRPAKSFLDLMKKAQVYEFYAFCDQDDIWEKEKLSVAIKKLEKLDKIKPALYYSTTEMVDENLKYIEGQKRDLRVFTFGEALTRNNVTGCTMVFNKSLIDLVNLYSPSNLMMHDHWVYLICRAFNGNVVFDSRSYIKYRQHASNAVGGKLKLKQKIKTSFLFSSRNIRQIQAIEIIKGYKDIMPIENAILLQEIANYKKSFKQKLALAINKKLRTNSKYDILFILSVIMKKY